MSTIQRMKAEDILQKQFDYQAETKSIVLDMLERGFSKNEISEEVGIHTVEITEIQKELKLIQKKEQRKEGTKGNKIFGSSIFGGRF